MTEPTDTSMSADSLVRVFAALSNPHRLRILAALSRERLHVSELARGVHLSRPLVHMHLQRLEAAGLVTGVLELSDEGRALKFYEVTPFVLRITPEVIAEAAQALPDAHGADEPDTRRKGDRK